MNSELIRALDLVKNGDWNAAHEIVQEMSTQEAAWIHGYLHRLEGDDSNAGYWYQRANVKFPKVSLTEEWTAIREAIS